jgi:hypothetical protein
MHTVSGVVSGLPSPLPGSALKLVNNGADTLTLTSNGKFAFPTSIASNVPFAVTVAAQPGNDTSFATGYTQTDVVCAVTANGNGVIADADITNVAVQCANKPLGAIYVANSGDNTLSTYLVDASGALIPSGAPVATGASPQSVVGFSFYYYQRTTPPAPVSFIYTGNSADNTLSIYGADPETGTPTPSGSALSLGLNGPNALILSDLDDFLYVADAGTAPGSVSAFSLANRIAPVPVTTDAVQPLGTAPIASLSVDAFCNANFNHYFYFLNATGNSISDLQQDATGGGLTPVATTPVSQVPSTAAAFSWISLEQPSPGGTGYFVYVANIVNNAPLVSSFTVNCGAGTPSGGLSSFGTPVPLNGTPRSAVTVTGGPSYLYVSIDSGIEALSISQTGVLAPQPIGVFPAGPGPGSLTSTSHSLSTTGATVAGSNQVTLTAADPTILPGMAIGGTGIPPNTVVNAVTGSTLTLSAPATVTSTAGYLGLTTTYLYVTNTGDNTISAFRVHFGTGELIPLGPALPCGTHPGSIFFVPRPSFQPS